MRKQGALAVVLLVLALLGVWLTATRFVASVARVEVTTTPEGSSSPRRETAANPPAGVLRADPEVQTSRPSLPERYSSLKAQANAGDIAAACRMAFELQRCAGMSLRQKGLLEMRRQAYELEERSPQRIKLEAAIETRAAELEEIRGACEGVDPIEAREGWRYLLQAANAGHLPSMLRFSHGFGLSWSGRPLDDLDQWTAYRDNMPAILERLVATGRPEAYAAAAKLYGTAPFGQSPLGRDPVKSLAFKLAIVRASSAGQERAIEEVQIRRVITEEKLDPAAVARAEALATTLAAKLDLTRPKVPVADGDCADGEARSSPPPRPGSRGPGTPSSR